MVVPTHCTNTAIGALPTRIVSTATLFVGQAVQRGYFVQRRPPHPSGRSTAQDHYGRKRAWSCGKLMAQNDKVRNGQPSAYPSPSLCSSVSAAVFQRPGAPGEADPPDPAVRARSSNHSRALLSASSPSLVSLISGLESNKTFAILLPSITK